jgi:transposase
MNGLKRTRCFRTRGKKGDYHPDPEDPPRCRANKQRGHGTYDNDRPPVIGTVGCDSGQVRLRVVHHTDRETLEKHVHAFTQAGTIVNTDEWQGYNHIIRPHATGRHGRKEWARDDDGDGIREVHVNTVEGMWTGVRNFLRPLRGVHKKYLSGYIAICEFSINLKRIDPSFISLLVTRTCS